MAQPIVPLGPTHQVWQLRAQWSSNGFAGGESSWSFVQIREADDFGEDLYLLWQTYLEGLFCTARPNGWALEDVLIEDRFPHVKPTLVIDYGGGLSPDSSGNNAPPEATPIITWRTGNIGRSYRGRTYWGPIRTADIDDGWHLGGDAEAALFDFGLAMVTQFGPTIPGFSPHMAIISRQHNGVPRPVGVFSVVEAFTDRQYLGTVRRRNGAVRVFV